MEPEADIRAVVETFRTSIINRDQAAFERLFLHEHITWQPVVSDAALQRILQKAPTATKLTVDASDTARGFFEHRGYVAQSRNSISIGDEWLANTTLKKELKGATP